MPDAEPNPEPEENLQTTPQTILGMPISALEADIEDFMGDRMSKLDEMLAGLEQLVQKIEGEMERYGESTDLPPQTSTVALSS